MESNSKHHFVVDDRIRESSVVSPNDTGFSDLDSSHEEMEVDQLCDNVEQMEISQQALKASLGGHDFESTSELVFIEEEYKEEIYSYLWQKERKYMLPPNFLSRQKEVSPHTRAVVIDWLVEVHEYYCYSQDVLFLAVSLMDRYLAWEKKPIVLEKLQLVGIACFQLSCKYEDRFVLDMDQLSQLMEGAFCPDEIKKMELDVLFTLEFNLNNPLSIHFLRAIARETNCDIKVYILGKCFLELSLLEPRFSGHLPSLAAYSSISLAQAVVNSSPSMPWAQHASYEWNEIITCVQSLARFLLRTLKPQWHYPAIREKYSRDIDFGEVLHRLPSSSVMREFALAGCSPSHVGH